MCMFTLSNTTTLAYSRKSRVFTRDDPHGVPRLTGVREQRAAVIRDRCIRIMQIEVGIITNPWVRGLEREYETKPNYLINISKL